jgi:hypothetical protein
MTVEQTTTRYNLVEKYKQCEGCCEKVKKLVGAELANLTEIKADDDYVTVFEEAVRTEIDAMQTLANQLNAILNP